MQEHLIDNLDLFIAEFKSNVCNVIHAHDTIDPVITYITNYKPISFDSASIPKRERNRNVVDAVDKCCAKRATGVQCSRKHLPDDMYCGTHKKNRPYGEITDIGVDIVSSVDANTNRTVNVYTAEINGIIYYKDKRGNFYDTDDVFKNIVNPRRIAPPQKINDVIGNV